MFAVQSPSGCVCSLQMLMAVHRSKLFSCPAQGRQCTQCAAVDRSGAPSIEPPDVDSLPIHSPRMHVQGALGSRNLLLHCNSALLVHFCAWCKM